MSSWYTINSPQTIIKECTSMSHNHFILKMLNIKDENIQVLDVIDTLSTKKEKTILIKDRLAYLV